KTPSSISTGAAGCLASPTIAAGDDDLLALCHAHAGRSARLKAASATWGKSGTVLASIIALSLPATDLGNHGKSASVPRLAVTCGLGKREVCGRPRARASRGPAIFPPSPHGHYPSGDADASAAIGDDVAIARRGARHSGSRRWLLFGLSNLFFDRRSLPAASDRHRHYHGTQARLRRQEGVA